jgi:hypothetical protein
LVRLAIVLLMEWVYLYILAYLSHWSLVNLPVSQMALRLMVPMVFFGLMGFAFSTVVRNGNGTVVVVVLVGLVFWVMSGIFEYSKWNLFLNPFDEPQSMSTLVWESVVMQSRLIWLAASAVFLLWGLINLQRRERFTA